MSCMSPSLTSNKMHTEKAFLYSGIQNNPYTTRMDVMADSVSSEVAFLFGFISHPLSKI